MDQPHWKPDPMETSTAQENGINEAGSEETDGPPSHLQIPAAGKILVWKSGRVAKKKTRDGENGARRNGKQKKPRPQRRGNEIPQHNSKVHIAPELPLGPVLSTIKRSDLSENEFPAYQAKVANVKDVASYSWVKGEESTIVVPGILPKWTASKNKTVWAKLDQGEFFKDPNAARSPTYPLEPVVEAIFKTDANFQASEVGLVACGSTMGNLLRYIQQDHNVASHIVKTSFRFLAEVVGDTVFFIRRENSPKETMSDMYGYWHGFMKKQTTPGLDAAGATESHQRVVGYEFAGMKMLVRYEADGFLPHPREELGAPCTDPEQVKADDTMEEILTTNTKNLALDKGLKVVTGTTTAIPLSALFDLKTRSLKSKDRDIVKEQLPRLWIRQLPYFIVAYHAPGSGCFHPMDTKMSNVTDALVEWEQYNENDLRKLVSLINKIVSAVKQFPDRKMEVRCGEDADVLELRSQTGDVKSVLPAGLAALWCTPAVFPKEEPMDADMSM